MQIADYDYDYQLPFDFYYFCSRNRTVTLAVGSERVKTLKSLFWRKISQLAPDDNLAL